MNKETSRREYQKGYYQKHKETILERSRRWYQKHRKRLNKATRNYHRRIKIEVLTHYSMATYPVCARCGVTDVNVLCLDHIEGKKEKLSIDTGARLYRRLKKAGFPEGFQVLCANCNLKKLIEEGV